jgi:hypothetical protein
LAQCQQLLSTARILEMHVQLCRCMPQFDVFVSKHEVFQDMYYSTQLDEAVASIFCILACFFDKIVSLYIQISSSPCPENGLYDRLLVTLQESASLFDHLDFIGNEVNQALATYDEISTSATNCYGEPT